jgi:hypothetical protein
MVMSTYALAVQADAAAVPGAIVSGKGVHFPTLDKEIDLNIKSVADLLGTRAGLAAVATLIVLAD